MKVKDSTIFVLFSMFISMRLFAIPDKVYNYTTYFMVLCIVVAAIRNKKQKLYMLAPFLITVLISTVLNNGLLSKTVVLSLLFVLSIFVVFWSMIYRTKNRPESDILTPILYFLLGMVFVNDFFLLTGISFREVYFFIGDKFDVAYAHMLLVALLCTRKRIYSFVKLAVALLSLIICFIVDCSTGVVGVAVMIILCFILNSKVVEKLLISWQCFLASFLGLLIIYNSISIIIQIPAVQRILSDVFHTDQTLTGRMYIYNLLLSCIEKKPLFGYGYLNDAVVRFNGWGNPQNGIIGLIVDYGLFGLITFAMLGVWVFFNSKSLLDKERERIYPIVTFVYAMMVCSIMEVSFGRYFFLALAIIYAMINKKGIKNGIKNRKKISALHRKNMPSGISC